MAENDEKIWKKFLKKHWQMFALFIVIIVAAIIGAIYVFINFVGDAQASGLVPEMLGLWSMGHMITFFLHLLLWEVIFIGIPVLIAFGTIYGLWWKNLPEKERKEYKDGKLFTGKRSRTDGGQFVSFLVFIVFAIKIFYDGNWGVPIATWSFDYLITSCLWSIFWIAIVFGIPMLIGGTWYLRHIMKK